MYDYGALNREGDGVKSAGIGSYCLMGSGNHLNSGRTPAPICAYLRDLAGWCDNEIILNGQTGVEAKHGAYDTVLKYTTAAPNEYFIVENRSKLGLDTHLPSSGLAVYHCDILGSNEFQQGTAQKHYQCALLQADGHTDLEGNANQGDGTDLFTAVSGVALSNSTTPSTRQWNGADSGLVITDIGVPDGAIDFRVGSIGGGLAIHGENAAVVRIPDANQAGIVSKFTIDRTGVIRSLSVKVDITHPYVGDLIVELGGPDGAKATLHSRAGGSSDNLSVAYDSTALSALLAFVGKPVQGEWTLSVKDVASRDEGTLNRFSIDAIVDGPPAVVRGQLSPKAPIPDNNPVGITSVIALDKPGSVRSLKLAVDITHTYIGDLRIELVAPSGRSVIVYGQLGGNQDNLVVSYDSSTPLSPLSGLVGQSIKGNWTLRIADLASVDVGTLNTWSLEIMPA
jgi:subtilisin-like proprotein convertase family protein